MSNLTIKNKHQKVEILVRGTVQGVGFRPFIYNLASRFNVVGDVCNTGDGVVIHASATTSTIELFTKAIAESAPPLARINSIISTDITKESGIADLELQEFEILASPKQSPAQTAIPPDIALCSECCEDIEDKTNRRYGYPFTNCTNCGPRFTIVETIPYDRPKTSMKVFKMCAACESEYHDPTNRRFHAQPNGCAECGPQLTYLEKNGKRIEGRDSSNSLDATVAALNHNKIMAIRGLGGFHLAVNALSDEAVAQLRKRKNRPDKPLAIMVRDLEHIRCFCTVSQKETELLLSPEHPIVLLKRKAGTPLATNLAPAIEEIGVMLPYTPLHKLLFSQPGCPEALVMTSGNSGGIPICTSNEDALIKLDAIADSFLLHNREIVTRVDDSVVKIVCEQQLTLRRSRGYTPSSIRVKYQLPKVLGCGAGLKNTFSLARGQNVFPSQHIGNLENIETIDFFEESLNHLQKVYQLAPEVVVCDLHPDYPSTEIGTALAAKGLPLYRAQHHHAHGVAVMAEHNLDEDVLAVILDGTGLGLDGTIWGGEFFKMNPTSYERLGHLETLHLPGGDKAATEPWRMALAALFATGGDEAISRENLPDSLQQIESEKLEVIRKMITTGLNTPQTSSCGRLFDAVASLLDVCQEISYEGQAAMQLEALAKKAVTGNWRELLSQTKIDNSSRLLKKEGDKWQILSSSLIQTILQGIKQGETGAALALDFHSELICCITNLIARLSKETGIRKVVLSGGCMQNSLLIAGLFHTIGESDIEAFTGNTVPVNDGGISIGQTVIGGLQHVSCDPNESHRH